jgi:hypothetical protein
MIRQPVTSSNLRAVGYDVTMKCLEVEFRHGGIYRYQGVPEHHYHGLITASSKGTYFAQFIKNTFAFTKIA